MKVFVGLGSNLGDRRRYLASAVRELRRLDPQLVVSPLYETAPVGGPAQGPYLNCVVRLDTDLSPAELLRTARRLEQEAARVRTVRNGPRTLDVDLLIVEGVEMATAELTLPHPRMNERAFVLAPLEDLDPTKVPPGWRQSVPGAERLAEDVRQVGTIEETTS